MGQERRVVVAQRLRRQPHGVGGARDLGVARSGLVGGVGDAVEVGRLAAIGDGGEHPLLGPLVDGAELAVRTARAETGRPLLHLPTREPVGLAGHRADGPLPARCGWRRGTRRGGGGRSGPHPRSSRRRGAPPSARPATCGSGWRSNRPAPGRRPPAAHTPCRRPTGPRGHRRTSPARTATGPPWPARRGRRDGGRTPATSARRGTSRGPWRAPSSPLPTPAAGSTARGGCRATAWWRPADRRARPRCGEPRSP